MQADSLNVAVQVRLLAGMEKLAAQGLGLHPAKVLPAFAFAVRVTDGAGRVATAAADRAGTGTGGGQGQRVGGGAPIVQPTSFIIPRVTGPGL